MHMTAPANFAAAPTLSTGPFTCARHLLTFWARRHISRAALLTMDQHQLADIGITRREAVAEANKPFWR